MPTMEEYLTRPVSDRLTRLRSTPDELARLLDGNNDRALSRRPDARSWSPKEIVCHLRDVEELFLVRFQTILAVEDAADPHPQRHPGGPGPLGHRRGVRASARSGPLGRGSPVRAQRRARGAPGVRPPPREVLRLLDGLDTGQWRRGGIHLARGRMELGEWVASLAGHDDNHLAQLEARGRSMRAPWEGMP